MFLRAVEPAGRNGVERPEKRLIEEAGRVEGRVRPLPKAVSIKVESRTTLPTHLQSSSCIRQSVRTRLFIEDHPFWR
jgi:hypothetical protein